MSENKKKFFEIFQRYNPDRDKRELLESADSVRVRIQREPYRVEVDAYFDAHKSQTALYEIEDELRLFYEAASFRIFPHYPESEFSSAIMPEIFDEAARVGAITKGFFDEAEIFDDGEVIEIKIPYMQSGIDFISSSNANDIITKIIEYRYSVKRQVLICESENAYEKTEERRRQIESEAERISRESALRMQAEMEAEAEKSDRSHVDL